MQACSFIVSVWVYKERGIIGNQYFAAIWCGFNDEFMNKTQWIALFAHSNDLGFFRQMPAALISQGRFTSLLHLPYCAIFFSILWIEGVFLNGCILPSATNMDHWMYTFSLKVHAGILAPTIYLSAHVSSPWFWSCIVCLMCKYFYWN